MSCVFPGCNYDGRVSREFVLYNVPQEASLRSQWLEALGKAEWDLEADAAVCSKHFLLEDFLKTRGGRKLRPDAVPGVNAEVCRICFASNCMLYPIKNDNQFDLSRPSYAWAYKTLTGLSIKQMDRLSPYLCTNCANRLLKYVRFRDKSIQAHSMLMEIVNDYGIITPDTILAVTNLHMPVNTDVAHAQVVDEHGNDEDSDMDNTYFQRDDTSDVSIKTESIDVVHHDILITDVRSIANTEHSLHLQNDSRVSGAQTDDNASEDIPIDDVTTSDHRVSEGRTSDDVITESRDAREEKIVNRKSNRRKIKTKLYRGREEELEFNNDKIRVVITGKRRSSKRRLPSAKARRKDKVRPRQEKQMTTHRKRSEVNGARRTQGKDKRRSSKRRLPSAKARRKDKVRPKQEKQMTTHRKHSNRTEVNGARRTQGKGGILLTYKLLACKKCTYSTLSKVQMMAHVEMHSAKVYSCGECYFLSKSKNDYLFHAAIHNKDRIYSCKTCKKKFTYKHDLKTHLRIHSGEKPYSCDICDKKFTQSTNLKVHLRIHSGEKPYPCKMCKKRFRQKSQLLNHWRIHSGEKPYSCDECKRSFVQKVHLKRHLLTHTKIKPFSCHDCGKSFRTKGTVQKHLIRIHANKTKKNKRHKHTPPQ